VLFKAQIIMSLSFW